MKTDCQLVKIEFEQESRNFLKHMHKVERVRPACVLETQLAGVSAGGGGAEESTQPSASQHSARNLFRRRFAQMSAGELSADEEQNLPRRARRSDLVMRATIGADQEKTGSSPRDARLENFGKNVETHLQLFQRAGGLVKSRLLFLSDHEEDPFGSSHLVSGEDCPSFGWGGHYSAGGIFACAVADIR